jgi:hypothetical protein
VAPEVQTLTTFSVSHVVPTDVFVRHDPRDCIVILERLPLFPHSIAQLETLGNCRILTFFGRRIVVAYLNVAVYARRTSNVKQLRDELSSRRKPRTYVAFD